MGGPRGPHGVHSAVIWAAWPDREPTWPAFLEGGAVLRITDANVNNWLPRALRNALTHLRYRRRNRVPPQPKPPGKRRPLQRTLPNLERDPHPPSPYDAMEGRAPPPVGERAGAASTGGGPLPRCPLTANC